MAETANGKKVVYVHPYTRSDGTRVPAHERSTPRTSHGQARKSGPRQQRRPSR